MKRIFFIAMLFAFFVYANAKDDESSIPSYLKSVIVYRSGAELTHTASATLKQGDNIVIIENVSNQVDVNSIQVKAPQAVTILGVEFSGNFLVPTEKSAREKMLDDSLEHVQQDIDKVELSVTNTTELLGVLKDNRNIKGEQTGMTVSELMKLMDYYKIKSLELQTDLQQLNAKKKKLDGLATKIREQITEEEKKNISTSGRITLTLSAATEGKYDFTISYIATNAYWTPYYDVRVDDINSPLKLSYKAKIVQTTGIDWKQVKLSLSTSTPAQWGSAPLLNAWFLAYVNPVSVMDKDLATNSIQYKKLNDVAVMGYATAPKAQLRGATALNDSEKPLYIVNGTPMSDEEVAKLNPNDIKSTNMLKGEQATSIYGAQGANGVIIIELKSGLEDYITVADNALNLTFDIDKPYDVPTNGKEQTATLQNKDVAAVYKHYAVPKLDKDVYLLAEIPGWEKLNLMPGDANIILEGTYVGKSFIDPSSTNDTLNLTLGRDERVAVKRQKLVDFSSVKFLGSNKQQKFTYEVTVKNNKAEEVNLLLKDQFPLSTNKDIEVELIDNNSAEVNSDIGILNWKLTLAPGESKNIRFVYSVKYPKDKTLNLN
jgi:TonB-dependent SusC/RagA subfamily outer membrane receptor